MSDAPDRAMSPARSATPARPRRLRWLRAGETAPAVRRRRPAVRLLIALTSSSALFAVVALVTAAAVFPPIGARRAAREAAQQEARAQLSDDERVVASVHASQRRWTDMFRESFGLLVATDRRVLFVGAPPTPLLRPREDGPDELLVESYPYASAFILEPRTFFRGLARGVELRTPGAHAAFMVDDENWRNALAVSRASEEARRSVTTRDAAFAESFRAPAPPVDQYVSYTVRRGETLTGLARRFETSPDVLRQLNQLTSDNIRVGQRLRVPLVEAPPQVPPS